MRPVTLTGKRGLGTVAGTRFAPKNVFMKPFLLVLGAVLVVGSAGAPAAAPKPASAHAKTAKHITHRPAGMPEGAKQYYANTWGVDRLTAKLAESGQLVRFDYRVIDTAKAAPLSDRAAVPQMVGELSHVVLQVPVMEKVGPLRQAMTQEIGKTYWMTFSNKGDHVKSGDRVSVLIGPVRIDGLIVQ